ncbi:hypothetical protein HDC94_000785 [Leifsonia sp. AK011]|uniref:DUF6121 family protein n=1 Tax=Leifsonia sp. AK011 TaxID=2723075 RepID=UPI0015CCCB75|nr:DUF6121 family protein [Leifsonia sp. AK011]NYF09629.1 hypothetical protein [Leifsonia sp. AK011]
MSAPIRVPPPADPRLLPVLVTVTYLAAVVAASGFLSLALDRDVIDYPDAGPLLGVVMVAAAGVVNWLGCSRSTRRANPWPGAFVTALFALVAISLVGAVGYALIRGSLSWMLLASAHFALSPFTAAAAILAGLAVVATWALARSAGSGTS